MADTSKELSEASPVGQKPIHPVIRSWFWFLIGSPLAFGIFYVVDGMLDPEILLPRRILAGILAIWLFAAHGYGLVLTLGPAADEIHRSFIFKPGARTGITMAAHGFMLVMTLLMCILTVVALFVN